jgi:hemoglobin
MAMSDSHTHPVLPTDFERLGGEPGLRRLIADFIDRVYDDAIIGFFFARVDRETLVQRELDLAAGHLGGDLAYRGRPIAQAHKPHPINRGHFHRRLWLLERTLEAHGVARDVIARWLAHDRRLEPVVTNQKDCLD